MRWNLRMKAAERRDLEVHRDAPPPGRRRSGDQRREDVGAVDRHADHDPPRRPRRDLRGARLQPGDLLICEPDGVAARDRRRRAGAPPTAPRRGRPRTTEDATAGVTQPKMCEGCGLKPQAYHGRGWCYTASPVPRQAAALPTMRLRRRLLGRRAVSALPPLRAAPPDSCRDCLAWGVPATGNGSARLRLSWRHLHPTPGLAAPAAGPAPQRAGRLPTVLAPDPLPSRPGAPRRRPPGEPTRPAADLRQHASSRTATARTHAATTAGPSIGPSTAARRDPRALGPRPPRPVRVHPIEDPARSYGFGDPRAPLAPPSTNTPATTRTATAGATSRPPAPGSACGCCKPCTAVPATPIIASDVPALGPARSATAQASRHPRR